MLAASGWPKMPKTPHSSLNLSNMSSGHTLRRNTARSRSTTTRSASSTGTIDHRLAADRDAQPVSAGLADDRAGTPAAAARCEHLASRRPATTETTTRDADSPNSAAATFTRAIARDRARRRSRPRRRCRRCRSSTPRASPRGRRRSSRAPIESAARPRASTSSVLQRALGLEIERRRHAAHQIVHHLQVFAAAELAAALAEQDDRRRPTPGTGAPTTRSACSSRPTTPMIGVG